MGEGFCLGLQDRPERLTLGGVAAVGADAEKEVPGGAGDLGGGILEFGGKFSDIGCERIGPGPAGRKGKLGITAFEYDLHGEGCYDKFV